MRPEQLTSKKTWGRIFWNMGHIVTFSYPENPTQIEKEQTARFFESFGYVLPCEECKVDYRVMMSNYPVRDYVENREKLSKWFYDIHCIVNDKLGKPSPPFEEVEKRFITEPVDKNDRKYFLIGGGVIVFIVIIVFFLLKRK